MLKHILTGQPATATSRHQSAEYSPGNGTATIHQHQHIHNQDHQPHTHNHSNHHNRTAAGGSLQHHHHHHQHQHQQQQNQQQQRGGSADVYDSIGPIVTSSSINSQRNNNNTNNNNNNNNNQSGIIINNQNNNVTSVTTPSSSSNHHPLNHSQLSVNNISQRLNHSHGLNLSTAQLSTSKHSVESVSPVVGNLSPLNLHSHINQSLQIPSESGVADNRPKVNGGLDITRLSRLPISHTATPSPALHHGVNSVPVNTIGGLIGPSIVPLNASITTSSLSQHNNRQQLYDAAGVKEMLTSLGLLCLVSLLLALLSLIFLLKIPPLTFTPNCSHISREEYAIVYEVTLALCALALSLNLCCLLVCAIQFLFAVKLVKSSYQGHRTNMYLQRSSISRVCAVGGFFISIPVFLTGMILYTFTQFQLTPAIVTSVFIGLGIIFCGCAMVHNVFVWQREKTNAINDLAREQCEAAAQRQRQHMQQQQQQQQQQQHQHQQQNNQQSNQPKQQQQHNQSHHSHQRGVTNQSIINAGSRGHKIGTIPQTNSSTTLPSLGRGQPYHTHNHHHVSIPISVIQNHLHQSMGSHRNVATPPTPGDLSPPSPSHKHNRSHTLVREISGSVSPGLPPATLDLSSAATTNSPHELSTLV